MKILVSACLLGQDCKYSGGNNRNDDLLKWLENHEVISVCPELMGGLSTPRPCAEIVGDQVMNDQGQDVTKEYLYGADHCTKIALDQQVDLAILQPRSPSCGCGIIYDGSFQGRLKAGDGVTTRMLKQAGIPVFSGDQLENFSRLINKFQK